MKKPKFKVGDLVYIKDERRYTRIVGRGFWYNGPNLEPGYTIEGEEHKGITRFERGLREVPPDELNKLKKRKLAKARIPKVQGAIEALQELLDWGQSHTAPIDEDAVFRYLQDTKKVLTQLEQDAKFRPE